MRCGSSDQGGNRDIMIKNDKVLYYIVYIFVYTHSQYNVCVKFRLSENDLSVFTHLFLDIVFRISKPKAPPPYFEIINPYIL